MRILYCGDWERVALYIQGALQHNGHDVLHVAPDEAFPDPTPYDVIILSDYPADSIGTVAAKVIAEQIANGTRLIMLGGWESFNGMGTGYYGHPLAAVLPVTLQAHDDRVNAHQGLIIHAVKAAHTKTQPDWNKPPVVCGYNAAQPKQGAKVLVEMHELESDGKNVHFGKNLPLVVCGKHRQGTVVACLTDLTPHWSGGMTDWGHERVHVPGDVEVGDSYPKFVQFILEC